MTCAGRGVSVLKGKLTENGAHGLRDANVEFAHQIHGGTSVNSKKTLFFSRRDAFKACVKHFILNNLFREMKSFA